MFRVVLRDYIKNGGMMKFNTMRHSLVHNFISNYTIITYNYRFSDFEGYNK